MKDIRFIDSIMGSGKSSAIIKEINDNVLTEQYIYCAPFIDETERIQTEANLADFKLPQKEMGSKAQHFASLVKEGENVAISHQLLKVISARTMTNLSEYNLVLDEVLDFISVYTDFKAKDIEKLIEDDVIGVKTDGQLFIKDMKTLEYDVWKSLITNIKDGKLYKKDNKTFILELPLDILKQFKSITIMSYLVEGSYLYQLLNKVTTVTKWQIDDQHKITTWNAALAKKRAKEYYKLMRFYAPVSEKSSKYYKINKLGKLTATSTAKLTASKVDIISKVTRNWFRTDLKKKANECLHSSFGHKIKVPNYKTAFLSYNARATNEYADRTAVAYLVDKNNNPVIRAWASTKHGIKVDEDYLALDAMLQWIFRSAIRNKKEIDVFVPSLKMRKLLYRWGCE